MTEGGTRKETATREFVIRNQYGIHARPASLLVRAAQRFDCDITFSKDGVEVSGKSIMGLMTLEAGRGSVVRVTAAGDGSEEALDQIAALFASGFDEE